MADFLDMVGQYAQNRLDQATQPFTDPSGYANNRFNNAFPGTETPEDRKKRLEKEAAERANTEIQTQQVKTYADGSRENTITTQEPPPQAVAPQAVAPQAVAPQAVAPQAVAPQAVQQAPAQQAPAQPVAPSTFDRMVQTESNGQQFAPNGQILTSPKGALGQAQIMPATAANPGFGVAPATPEEIATPEGNKAFGQRYYQGLLQHFGGDEQKAVAAYNAGPGRVQQNVQANNGQLNVAQLPQETQDYLQKVQRPIAPQQAQVSAPSQPLIAGNASSDVSLTPTEQAIQQQKATWNNDLEKAQNDPTSLYAIAGNREKYPEPVRKIAIDKARQIELDDQKKLESEKLANDGISGKDPKKQSELMRAITTKSEEGSYIKAYLFSRLGLNELAKEEQDKLSGPKFAQALVDGKQYFVETKGGAITAAYNDAGAKITDDKTLSKINTSYINPTKSETGAEVYYDPMKANGPRFAYVRTPTGGTYREVGTGRVASPQEQAGLVKMGVAGPIEQQAAAAYARSGAGQQGKQAAEEGTSQGALPPRTVSGTQSNVQQGTVGTNVSQGQVAQTAPAAPTSIVTNPNQQAEGTATGGSYAERKIAREVGGKRSESFNKIIDTEYRENGQKGEVVSNNRKQQFDILNRIDPSTGKGIAETITGLYTAANENPNDQKLTLIRDIFTGKIVPEKEISQRIAQLNISPEAKSALIQYNSLNAQIAAQTLRETAGPGSVSDAEQAANKARNVDITQAPMLGAYNIMGQSQFNADLQRYKSDLSASTTAPNATVFDRDFRKDQAKLIDAYRKVTEARLDFIDKNGGAQNPAAIREGYKRFPVPVYDVDSGNWKHTKPMNEIFK